MNPQSRDGSVWFALAGVLTAGMVAGCDVTVKTGPLPDGAFGSDFTGSGGQMAMGGRVGSGGQMAPGGRIGSGGMTPILGIDANTTGADLRAPVDGPVGDGPVARDVPIADRPVDGAVVAVDAPAAVDTGPVTKAACDKLEKDFTVAMENAARCNPAATNQCQKQIVSGSVRCSFCQTFVEDDVAVKALRASWRAMNCDMFFITPCPVASCVALMPAKCRPVDAGPGGVCTEF